MSPAKKKGGRFDYLAASARGADNLQPGLPKKAENATKEAGRTEADDDDVAVQAAEDGSPQDGSQRGSSSGGKGRPSRQRRRDGSSSSSREPSSGPSKSSRVSGGPSKKPPEENADEAMASVPKGQGRMRQQRAQLNVRIPLALKRQATAKAVLEGKDIGEVVEELLREYLEAR